ncbi:MAG: DEAD/DEAH box helicase, partial [Faecousia sp.]
MDTQAAIDAALQEWNGDIRSKQAVVRYMKDHARDKNTAAWLKQEYGDDLPAFPVPAAATDLPWAKVQRRIAQLIKEDRFFTEEEQDHFDDIDPIAIRETLEQRGIVNGQVIAPEKLDQDPFIRQVTADVERIAQEGQTQAPDLSGQPITRQGDTITIGNGETTHEIDITVSDEEWQQIQDALPDTADRNQQAPPYQVGDTVYLDDTAFEITSIGLFDVQLRDPALPIPIFRAESKERFE